VAAIQTYLNTTAAQGAISAAAFVPQSTQFDALQIYNQLETLGKQQTGHKLLTVENRIPRKRTFKSESNINWWNAAVPMISGHAKVKSPFTAAGVA